MMRLRRLATQYPISFILLCMLTAFAFVLFFCLRNPVSLDDGLRHIIFARTMFAGGTHGWSGSFFAGYHSVHDFDPWFLSHVLYIPFSFIPDIAIGLKAFTLVGMALLAVVFQRITKRYALSTTVVMLCMLMLFFGSTIFTGRLLLGRPYIFSVCILLLAYNAIVTRNFFLFTLWMFIGVLLSHLFVFYLLVGGVGTLWLLCIAGEGMYDRVRSALLLCVAMVTGSAAGIVAHPQSKEYLAYLRNVFFKIPFSKKLGIGRELFGHVETSGVLLLCALGGAVLLSMVLLQKHGWRNAVKQRPEAVFTAVLVCGFFAAFVLWARAIDYLWPFLILFLAQLLSADARICSRITSYMDTIVPVLRITLFRALVLACVVNIFPVITYVIIHDRGNDIARYDAIQSLPSGARVLNLNWDVYPILYSLRPDLLYARGMDPSFDYYHDAEGFRLLTQGEHTDDISQWLQDLDAHFQPDYLALHKKKDNTDFVEKLHNASEIVLEEESEEMVVFGRKFGEL